LVSRRIRGKASFHTPSCHLGGDTASFHVKFKGDFSASNATRCLLNRKTTHSLYESKNVFIFIVSRCETSHRIQASTIVAEALELEAKSKRICLQCDISTVGGPPFSYRARPQSGMHVRFDRCLSGPSELIPRRRVGRL
jgi:hypothetical protein